MTLKKRLATLALIGVTAATGLGLAPKAASAAKVTSRCIENTDGPDVCLFYRDGVLSHYLLMG